MVAEKTDVWKVEEALLKEGTVLIYCGAPLEVLLERQQTKREKEGGLVRAEDEKSMIEVLKQYEALLRWTMLPVQVYDSSRNVYGPGAMAREFYKKR